MAEMIVFQERKDEKKREKKRNRKLRTCNDLRQSAFFLSRDRA